MKDIFNKVLIALKDYYITIALFAFATIQMMITIRNGFYNIDVSESQPKIILTLIYGAIISLVIRNILFRLKDKLYNLLYLFVPLLMAFVYFIILHNLNTASVVIEYFVLCFLTSILVFVVPFIRNTGDSDYYTYKVLISLLLTNITYQILIMGTTVILGSISLLFEFPIKEDLIYPEIFIFILGFIMPTLFLTLMPKFDVEKKEYPNFINTILMYVIFPILSIYTVVLYSYFIKILIEFKLPSNMLGNLTIYYSLFSIGALYFTKNMNNKWSSYFTKIYPYTLIIPMLMMLVSFVVRINQYGFTESRYYALLIFIFVMSSIFILKKVKQVKCIPIVLSVLLFISIVGPFSASNVSKWSQEARLKEILNRNNMLVNNEIKANSNISKEDQDEIDNILAYFSGMHEYKDLKFLPKDFTIEDMEKTFGF